MNNSTNLKVNPSNINNIINYRFKLKIDEYFCKYLILFSCQNINELITKLKKLDYDTRSVCARKMLKIGGWKCSDCEKNANSILCQQCWRKVRNKHLKHNILYNISTNGTCDCGDPNILTESLFCPNHKGPLTKEIDIQNNINKCFSPEFIQSFENITKELIIEIVIPYIINIIKNNDFRKNIKYFIDIINVLSHNKALMHIISKIFLTNYKFKTKHNCLLINDNEIKFIKNNEEHDCCCPIIRIIMAAWTDVNQENNQDILYKYLLNYKLRKTMGIIYFLLFGYFIENLINDFNELSVQYIFDDVCTTTAKIPGLIEYYLESILQIIKYFTNNFIFLNKENCPLVEKIKNYNKNSEVNYLIISKK